MEKIMNCQKLRCGIVILNYNDYETTRNLLEMIQGYESLAGIVVVDNHSTDGSYDKLRKHENEKIRVILSPENGGYSKGNNLGIKFLLDHDKADIIGISNSDVEFDETLVRRILYQFEKRPAYSVITGLQVTPSGEIAGHPFWKENTTTDWFARKLPELNFIHLAQKSKKNMNRYVAGRLKEGRKFFRTGAVEGSLFFIRARDLLKIGLLDEGIWMYYEEDVLSKKIKQIGKRVGVDTTVKYIHYGEKTTSRVLASADKINHIFRSAVYYFNHYQSEDKMLQGLNYILCRLIWIKQMFSIQMRKGIKCIVKKQKEAEYGKITQ